MTVTATRKSWPIQCDAGPVTIADSNLQLEVPKKADNAGATVKVRCVPGQVQHAAINDAASTCGACWQLEDCSLRLDPLRIVRVTPGVALAEAHMQA